MSKGMNASHIEDGEYSVEIELDTSDIATELADLATEIAEADAQIATANADIASTDAELDATRSSISTLNPQITEKSQDITTKSTRVDTIVDEIAAIDVEIADLEAEQTPLVGLYAAISSAVNQLASQIATIEAELVDMPPGPERDALEAELSDKQSTKEDLDAQLLSVGEEIAEITNAIALLNIDKGVLEAESSTLEGEIDTLQGELDTLVDQRRDLQDDIVDLEKKKSELQLKKAMLILKKAGFQKRIDFLNDPANVPENETLDIWCADLTEDLSGDVGVIEVAGVRGNGFNLQPGYAPDEEASPAIYDSNRDGTLKPSIVVSAASAYWNWGMQGGWQKWMPTHRYGTISALDTDTDTCTVTFDAETNPDTDLDINQGESLTDVAILYMDCDSAAFADGDEVLVEFQENDWDSPQVIGFKDHPKPCAWETWPGPEIDSYHAWLVFTAGLVEDSEESVEEGILSLMVKAQSIPGYHYSADYHCVITLDGERPDQQLEIDEVEGKKTHLHIYDIETSILDQSEGFAGVILADSDGNEIFLIFDGGTFFTDPEIYYITPDEGDIDIIISDYNGSDGVPLSNIAYVFIATRSWGQESTFELGAIDFLEEED